MALKFSMETKFDMKNTKIKEKLAPKRTLWHLPRMTTQSAPMDLKFSMETKFDMENTNIKEKLDIDTYLINYA